MAFCPRCGNNLNRDDVFCPKCGNRRASLSGETRRDRQPGEATYTSDARDWTSVDMAQNRDGLSHAGGAEIDQNTASTDPADVQGVNNIESPTRDMPSVDRKTRFADGVLVLTNEDVVLYGGDERDEIKRIPIRDIESCKSSAITRIVIRAMESGTGGRVRRALVIRKRINMEQNFSTYLNEQEEKLVNAKVELKKSNQRGQFGTTIHDQKISSRIEKIHTRIAEISNEVNKLRTDPDYIHKTKLKKSDIKKESFEMPPDSVNPDREYNIWEHAINRRLEGIRKIRVATTPPDALLVVDGQVCDSTPCIIDKPLTEDSALSGKHKLEMLLEGYKRKAVTVDARPRSDSKNIEIVLEPLGSPDDAINAAAHQLRKRLPDRSIDTEQYNIEYEVVGIGHRLLLERDELLIVSHDAKRCLLNIPYGAIRNIKLDKKIRGGIQGIRISYDEGGFSNVQYRFVIDVSAYSNSKREAVHRYETLLEKMKRKKSGSYAQIPSPLRRSSEYYHITEEDITNGFRRFDPYSFEKLVAHLFAKKGYDAEVTRGSGDMGVDVMARNSTEAITIQVKKWNANVGGPDVHKTLGSMVSQRATRAIMITTSDFTNQAYEIQKSGSPIELWNGKRLNAELRTHLMAE